MKGIILAGGSGTRLYPMTRVVNKQLMPGYNKPMVYYPLSVLMLAGIREILIISGPNYLDDYRELFGDGHQLGLQIEYAAQPRPEGLPQAFIIGREFIGKDSVCLVLGDNIFYGSGIVKTLREGAALRSGAKVFVYRVKDPERYGVVEFDAQDRPLALVEKPAYPKSNYALTGIYFADNRVVEVAGGLRPSTRGELEIVDVMDAYLKRGELQVFKMGRGIAWLDTGTPEALLKAAVFIQAVEERQGLQVACIEEIAYNLGYINVDQLRKLAEGLNGNPYGQYLLSLLER